MNNSIYTRRDFLGTAAWTLTAGAAALYVPGAFAQQLQQTPRQTEGPFYPNKLPLDTDNDLLVVNDNITPAVGEITHLTGRVLDAKGQPVRNAVVEIWQCDVNGAYLHTGDSNHKKYNFNFQALAVSLPARPANTTSARSSPCRIQAERRTFITPSSRATNAC